MRPVPASIEARLRPCPYVGEFQRMGGPQGLHDLGWASRVDRLVVFDELSDAPQEYVDRAGTDALEPGTEALDVLSNSLALWMVARILPLFLMMPGSSESLVMSIAVYEATLDISKPSKALRKLGHLFAISCQLRPAWNMQRVRFSKYCWSVVGRLSL